jgi:hypothetical protein
MVVGPADTRGSMRGTEPRPTGSGGRPPLFRKGGSLVIRTLFLVLVAASAASASSSIKGVVSAENGQLIFDAKVRLLNPANQEVLYETSVVHGTFRIEPVEPGSYFLSVKAVGFRECADSVSVAQDQAVDMGRIAVRVGPTAPDIVLPPTPPLPKPGSVDEHVRFVHGIPVMTVCEYLNLRSVAPLVYPAGVIVIGILVQTPQGSRLQQSCRDSLRSGDYFWPNAIALEGAGSSRLNWADFLPNLTRPSNEELDPRDREGNWAAFVGRLETRDGRLAAAPCGSGKMCGYGYGAISAPAQLLYHDSYYFDRAK